MDIPPESQEAFAVLLAWIVRELVGYVRRRSQKKED